MSKKNHYDILEIHPTASQDEIRKAYRRLIRTQHPDKFFQGTNYWLQAHENSQTINDAYQILKDAQKREEYDYVFCPENRFSVVEKKPQEKIKEDSELEPIEEWSADWHMLQINVLKRCKNYEEHLWLSKALEEYKEGGYNTEEDWISIREATLQQKIQLEAYEERQAKSRDRVEKRRWEKKRQEFNRRARAEWLKQTRLSVIQYVFGIGALLLTIFGVVVQFAILFLLQYNLNFQTASFKSFPGITGPMYQTLLAYIRIDIFACIVISCLMRRSINKAAAWGILYLVISFAISALSSAHFGPLAGLYNAK